MRRGAPRARESRRQPDGTWSKGRTKDSAAAELSVCRKLVPGMCCARGSGGGGMQQVVTASRGGAAPEPPFFFCPPSGCTLAQPEQ